jgi:hypothetical protein
VNVPEYFENTPVEFLSLIFSDDIIQHISERINWKILYSRQHQEQLESLKKKSQSKHGGIEKPKDKRFTMTSIRQTTIRHRLIIR